MFRLFILLLAWTGAQAATFDGVQSWRRRDDRIWLSARNAPVEALLTRLNREGVRVRYDPSIDHRITGEYRAVPIDTFFKKELGHFTYVLSWDRIDSPLGPMLRLESVELYKPGRRLDAIPLRASDPLELTTGPDPNTPLHVADEILLAAREGTTVEAFMNLIDDLGGTLIDGLPDIGVYRIRLPRHSNVPALVSELTGRTEIAAAEPNYATPLPSAQTTSGGDAERIQGTVFDETAAPVAVLDSGFQLHPSTEALPTAVYDALEPGREPDDPAGHGTQMALLASGAIAPEGVTRADIGLPVLAIRAFDSNGYASNFGIMRAVNTAREQGAKVMNMSWGTETKSAFLENAMRRAAASDLVLIASAGNEPTGRPLYPAAYDTVLAVAGVDAGGRPWASSNYGDFVHCAAPAAARFPVGYEGPPGAYIGTSTSAALTSRVLGQYRRLHPEASAADALSAFRSALSAPADPSGRYGDGVLDQAAIQRLLSP